ncbi:hypothetical protein GIB67_018185 [Kingdonia uniflora]|uniref:Uncharacterized protein n=1 Tax=Kingdonia uniflora TaxID=39325 RepID=A0A7J7NMD5_9MAGN|nr:hypothetical protein GIB67_018185 [Kingdonia uniflora]
MIINNEYPFNKVEHKYFKEFVNNLNPQFKLISHNTLKWEFIKKKKENCTSSWISLTLGLVVLLTCGALSTQKMHTCV